MPDTIVNENELPLVSCIMPTYNRRRFVPYAIEYFLRQDYPNKELIIIDDGEDIVQDLIPVNPAIRYFKLAVKITLGAKLNMGCSYASGEILANWDDDDWYARTRLRYQVNALIENNAEVCGINNLLYYDFKNETGYNYIYPVNGRIWLLGSSLCYTRKLWTRNPFADINVGMDALFVWAAPPDNIKILSDTAMSVHMIHDSNVSPKKTDNIWWHKYPVAELEKIMKEDWLLYKNGNGHVPGETFFTDKSARPAKGTQKGLVKNIYACLVHESRDCIVDLVQNLQYHDPSSIILLYNGGTDNTLLVNTTSLNKSQIVIHPKPVTVSHGYLHHFAVECMEYALNNFDFDCLTIVDSDQLAIRSGYSGYMWEFLNKPGIGLFSSDPRHVGIDDTYNRVAMQAFKEYDLWKPLLNDFKNGENNFVHWTFWPATVFTKDAAKDLVKLFKENKKLHNIVKHTRIWASEEIILPTLVKLLGYDIVSNPCSYDFVQYQQRFTIQEVSMALQKNDAYWLHPVERVYNSPIRKFLREYFSNYNAAGEHTENTGNNSDEPLFRKSLINKVKTIEGWLSDVEAEALINITEQACNESPSVQNIIDIGSYHGKSTIIFGSVIKRHFPNARVYSIDPHDGKLGDAVKGLDMFPPSYEKFRQNIKEAGLTEHVAIIRDHSCNVRWEQPVLLLFIDGLHDYANVSRDFYHFANRVSNGGYVAFHDYADYYPGVKKLVDELLKTKNYLKINNVGSLVILQKK